METLQNEWLALASCLILSLAIMQGGKVFRVCVRAVRSVVLKFSSRNALKLTCLTLLLFLSRGPLFTAGQWVAGRLNPVYFGQFDTVGAEHEALIFEQEIQKRNPDNVVSDEVIRATTETAAKMRVPRLWLYQCAFSECGLKPFTIRTDRVAASWVQMTRAGLTGISLNGRPAKMADVFAACESRDIVTVMDFADTYLIDRWMMNRSPDMTRAVDVYLLLFAPALVCSPGNRVIYQGFKNPSYYMNAGLDGWQRDGSGRIFQGAKDGQITVFELENRCEYLKNSLLKKYLK